MRIQEHHRFKLVENSVPIQRRWGEAQVVGEGCRGDMGEEDCFREVERGWEDRRVDLEVTEWKMDNNGEITAIW
jgi:hypothetical protein